MLLIMDLAREREASLVVRTLVRVWGISAVAVLLIFWIMGAQAFARDVGVIQTEMVATARWIGENTDVSDVIAAHDIGTIGYFTDREIIDLAGLVSPDVIPFIRDENRLADYMEASDVDYLVTFPDWYPILVEKIDVVFQTSGEISPSLGGENMAVYRWMSE